MTLITFAWSLALVMHIGSNRNRKIYCHVLICHNIPQHIAVSKLIWVHFEMDALHSNKIFRMG